MLKDLGVDVKTIVPIGDTTKFTPEPNAKKTGAVNGKKFNTDKLIISVGLA